MLKLVPPLFVIGLLAVFSVPSVSGAQAQTAQTTNPDVNFAVNAASAGHAEVTLGRIALAKSTREDVRGFAQRMVDDHTKANLQLSELAMREHIRLPRAAQGQDAAEVKRLSGLSGNAFDRAYVDLMVDAHRHDLAAFEREARDGQVAPIRSLANATLPMLREHLAMAEQLQRSGQGEEKAQAPSGSPSKGQMQ